MTIGEAIRAFRLECAQTQIQFAVALAMSATSIHRFESGASLPDLDSLKKFHQYAVQMGNYWAKQTFFQEMIKKAGFDPNELADTSQFVEKIGPPPDPLAVLEIEGARLNEAERLWAVAIVLGLRRGLDPTVKQVIETILAPFLSDAQYYISEIFGFPVATKEELAAIQEETEKKERRKN